MNPSKVLSFYKIRYSNGVEQTKGLILQSDYENDIKPSQIQIDELESKRRNSEAMSIKKRLNVEYGDEWFTTESPLGLAIKTGVISMPKIQGGKIPVTITIL